MFEADEAQWPLVVVRSTESGSASDNADAYVALWERWLARGCHFGVLVVAGEARGEAPPPELAIRMRAWQEAARDRIRSSCVGIAYVMPSLSVLAAHRPIVRRRSEISLGCTGDAFGSVNEAGHGLASACDSLTLATSRLMAASRGGHQAARPACRLRARARGAVHDTTRQGATSTSSSTRPTFILGSRVFGATSMACARSRFPAGEGVCEVMGCRAPMRVTAFRARGRASPLGQPSSDARQGRALRPRLPALVADGWPGWDGNRGRAGAAGHRHDSAPARPRSLPENAAR